MPMIKKLLILGLLAGLFIVVLNQKQVIQTKIQPKVTPTGLHIVSTKPDPLEDAVILPNQSLEFNFNESFDTSYMKFRLDPPEIDLVITTPDKTTVSQTIIVNFKKPLKLGNGYTLFVSWDPANSEKKMDQEYVYHFQTI